MAAAIFNHLTQENGLPARAISAGTMPAEETDQHVAETLSRNDIEYTNHKPQKLTTEMLDGADQIVSFGCLIPDMFPKEKFAEWLVEDPNTDEEYESAFHIIVQNVTSLQKVLTSKMTIHKEKKNKDA